MQRWGALSSATSGDQIRVAAGTYKPDQDESGNMTEGGRSETFQLITGVGIYGGYAGVGNADNPNERDIDSYETKLSGDLAGDDGADFLNNSENSLHVVSGSSTDDTAVLDGFSITGGNANGGSYDMLGGGVFALGGAPSLYNCIITGNSASSSGGGAYWGKDLSSNEGSTPVLEGCLFEDNRASGSSCSNGGGMAFDSDSPGVVIDCAFSRNRADCHGGGVYAVASSDARFLTCRFVANWSGDSGGGLSIALESNVVVTRCTFSENEAGRGGGASCMDPSELVLANCRFDANAAGVGGALFAHLGARLDVLNCTLVANDALDGQGLGLDALWPPDVITVGNSILWNGGNEISPIGSSIVSVAYCDVFGGWPGIGNIETSPLFVDADGDNFRLQSGSLCIDAGLNSVVTAATDLDGNVRIVDDPATPDCQQASGTCGTSPIVDMGAYEYPGIDPIPVVSNRGVIILTLLTFTVGSALVMRRTQRIRV